MSNYPERPLRKGRPKSSHSGSRKGRTWLQKAGVPDAGKREEAHLWERGCVIGHTNPALVRFLAAHRGNKVPWGHRMKAGPRPYLV